MALHPLYPNRYVWFVFLSALDALLTYVILWIGGGEANAIARWVLEEFDFVGMVVFKFAIVVFVILLCEYIGRRSESKGRKLAEWSIALTCIPVVIAFTLLMADLLLNGGNGGGDDGAVRGVAGAAAVSCYGWI